LHPQNQELFSYRLDLQTGEVVREAFLRDVAGFVEGVGYTFATPTQEEALRAAAINIIRADPDRGRFYPDEPRRPREALMWVTVEGVTKLLPSGKVEEFGPRFNVTNWALSPDGTQLAWASGSDGDQGSMNLLVMPVKGGEIRELAGFRSPSGVGDDWPRVGQVRWTPDGQTLLYQVRYRDRGYGELWQVPAAGGAPARLALPLELGRLTIRPDGRSVAFWTQRGRNEVWLMERFPWQDSGR